MTANNIDTNALSNKPVAKEPQDTARRDLLLAIGGAILYALLAFGIIIGMNVRAGFTRLLPVHSPVGDSAIDISLVHTNDTWGYTDPCG